MWPVAVGGQAVAPVAHPARSLRWRLGERNPAPATRRGRWLAQGNDYYRVPFGKLRRRIGIPTGSAPPSSAPCNDDYRPFDKLRRRALNGPDQEVYFPQEHPPGREAYLDFPHCNSLGVTIGGQRYRHLLSQPVLSHSRWRYAEVVSGETFLTLQQGLQNALWELGGAPQVIRSDNTSVLTHEIKRSRCTPTPWIVNELGLGISVTGRGAVEGRGSVSGAAPVGGTSSVVRRRRG